MASHSSITKQESPRQTPFSNPAAWLCCVCCAACAGAVPPTVTMRIKEAAPHMKGETAAPSYKPAVLENGIKVMVPPFVQQGDEVVVDTQEGSFVKRA